MGVLHNKVNKWELREKLMAEPFKRITLSFYCYHQLSDPKAFRDELYIMWDAMNVFGRVHVAKEGINAQISVPEDDFERFKTELYTIDWLNKCRLNIAVDDDGKSFFKLKIKVRDKILADGLTDETFDVTDKGTHLNAPQFNELIEKGDTVLIDMRNHYETEVGHFKGAVCPDVDTFRDSLPVIEEDVLKGNEEKHIVMYCTGGIRCEKASAWFKHKGYEKVYQLDGGIINYANQIKEAGLENKFVGKNFVFDERMGERISEEIISHCHQCGKPCDTHTDCANNICHILFIQCEECAKEFDGCCSEECTEILALPKEEQEKLRKGMPAGSRVYKKGRLRPTLGDLKTS